MVVKGGNITLSLSFILGDDVCVNTCAKTCANSYADTCVSVYLFFRLYNY